jgi:ankyrin repeat protein
MSEQETGKRIPSDDQVAVELLLAVRVGDVAAIQRLLRNDPALASARLVGKDGGGGTPLHLVTDWPGYFPNGPEIVRLLIDAGADPNALTTSRGSQTGPGDETPLHYAASSDDVDVAEALIEAGADLETPDGSIGTPLDNAVGYGCWHVARLLVTRGARVDKAWHAAALGMLGRLEALLGSGPPAENVSQAFWHACTGGQRRAAEYLLSRGADLNWEPDYAHGTPLDAASGLGPGRRTSSPGCASWEPVPPAPIDSTRPGTAGPPADETPLNLILETRR